VRTQLRWLPKLAVALLAATAAAAATSDENAPASSRRLSVSYVNYQQARSAALAGHSLAVVKSGQYAAPNESSSKSISANNVPGSGQLLPLWSFNALAARDGQRHQGVMVGTSPFGNATTSEVPTKIIPVVLVINSIATSFDAQGNVTTVPGKVVFDPTAHDKTCMSAPNNVPVQVLRQSPLFESANFTFGGTFLGHTQYEDAFMRANFYSVLNGGSGPGGYHVLFNPVSTLKPLVLNVPPSEGYAITDAAVLGGGFCAPLAIVGIDWLDDQLNDQVLPDYAAQGVNPTNLPIFMLYATFMAAPVSNIAFGCCIGGYHSFGGFPTPTQAYSVFDFDVTGILGTLWPDSAIGSHELGEFLNDPFGNNLVPPWGDTGQVAGCQGNLEVGDPLTGSPMAPVTMPNGYNYHLQELAFFSWFIGGPSLAANGWYSSNGTFTTDAGAPCLLQ